MKKLLFSLVIASVMLISCNNETSTQDKAEVSEKAKRTTETLANAKPIPQSHIPVNGPTVVDFYADWCGPCKQLAPILDNMEKKYVGKVQFMRINVDEQPDLAREFAVQSIPTLFFLTTDGIVDQTVGVIPESELDAKINALL